MGLNLPSAKELLEKERNLKTFSTGCLWLDLAIGKTDIETGLLGIPEGTICEFFGPNQTLKTGTAEQLTRSVLARNKNYYAIYILSEEPNVERMSGLGLDLDRIKVWTFVEDDSDEGIRKAEGGLDIVNQTVLTDPNCKLIVIDSIKALASEQELVDGKNLRSLSKDNMAPRAKLMNKFLNQFVASNKANAVLFMTNQISESIGPDFLTGGNFKPKTSGGRGKEHIAFLRVECDSIKIETEDKHPLMNCKIQTGLQVFYTIHKNKFAKTTGNRRAIASFSFAERRFLREKEILSLGCYLDVIETRGAYYVYDGVKVHGKEAMEKYLFEHPEQMQKIEKEVVSKSELIFQLKAKVKAEEVLNVQHS